MADLDRTAGDKQESDGAGGYNETRLDALEFVDVPFPDDEVSIDAQEHQAGGFNECNTGVFCGKAHLAVHVR